jgi:glycosyltransferase involved in cell wall biosynthesis
MPLITANNAFTHINMPKLLFVTTLPFYPDASGGGEQFLLYLFQSLRQLGWKIEVICGLSLRSPYFRRACWQALMHFQKPSLSMMDEDLGFPCWRQLRKFSQERQSECLDQRLREYRPDVVLSHDSPNSPLLKYAAHQGYPSFYFAQWLSKIVVPNEFHTIANSPFTASVIAQFTRNEVGVVLPLTDLEQYRVIKRERQYITFINPIPQKGLDVAIEIARCLPQERFLFVKGKWGKYSASTIEAFMKPIYKLPNVEVWEHQRDMRQVYAVTDILLVPSQFNETFGRVIVEAQANGIPVVAANVGGIPYSLGRGGILVEPKNEPQAYVDALQRLRTDENLYMQLSDLALQNSQRPEFDPQYQVKNFIRFVESRIKVTS